MTDGLPTAHWNDVLWGMMQVLTETEENDQDICRK